MPKLVIYTDGSCEPNPGPGGWAALLQYTNNGKTISRRFSGHDCSTTNNRMEIMAVLAVLRRLKQPCELTIYSDSQYVVNSIGNWRDGKPVKNQYGWMVRWHQCGWIRPATKTKIYEPRNLKNSDLWKEIHQLVIRQTSVTMRWIRGHSGNKFNELCDVLAMEERVKAATWMIKLRQQIDVLQQNVSE